MPLSNSGRAAPCPRSADMAVVCEAISAAHQAAERWGRVAHFKRCIAVGLTTRRPFSEDCPPNAGVCDMPLKNRRRNGL